MSSITIENVGVIKHVEIPIPETGGVVVLRGGNGRGKSTALRAVDAAATGKGGLPLRDGTEKGLVQGCGVKLTVGKSTRSSGKLEVETLEGRLSLADLVGHGLKSDAAADAKRVRAMVQLAGKPLSLHDFESLLPKGELEFPDFEVDAGEEALQLADRLKRHCEGVAREKESKAEGLANEAKALRLNAGDVDATVVVDRDKLAAEVQQTVINRQKLASAKDEAERDSAKRLSLKQELRVASAGFGGVDKPREELQVAQAEVAAKKEEVLRLQTELARSTRELGAAESDLHQKRSTLDAAEKTQAMIDRLTQAIAANPVVAPTESELTAAEQAVSAAAEAQRVGLDAINKQGAAKVAAGKELAAKELAKAAAGWRDAAGKIPEILSARIATLGTPLFVDGQRLCLKTDRGQTFFSELSAGERWRLVIDIAVGLLGANSLLTIPQEAWEGLQPKVRAAINEHAKERGVVIIAAQASDDAELVAEAL